MQKNKKVELLSPAGNFSGFVGALNAGADAVYLGGEKFGARAFADNFSPEEVIEAIRLAHIHGRKIYMTANTLMKERELEELPVFLKPYVNAGLDAVIIQDLGAFMKIGACFPGLSRHISTQMTITGAHGAAYLKNLGAERIVPARELSLEEIIEIKKQTGIEMETFIHGAVCYCYSGQCLFSSMIGGRSGNRGRCAQPCRLPYQTDAKKPTHLISLKDMCTIKLLPELIGAGIDSFKIEGRMKSPEYTAAVTAVYRKYIDRYYERPQNGLALQIEAEDMDILNHMYIRSEISEGYYHRYHGPEMITLKNPGYAGQDEALIEQTKKKYLEKAPRLHIHGNVALKPGTPATLKLRYGEIQIQVSGELVEEAKKQPLSKESIEKQMNKTQNSNFIFDELGILLQGGSFLPVSVLNQLRRDGFLRLEEEILKHNAFAPSYGDLQSEGAADQETGSIRKDQTIRDKAPGLHVFVSKQEQLKEVCHKGNECMVERIYISSDLFMGGMKGGIWQILEQYQVRYSFYIAMPYIIRQKENGFLEQMKNIWDSGMFSGLLVRNLEEIQWMRQLGTEVPATADIGLYCWNQEAAKLLRKECREQYLPVELNAKELTELRSHTTDMDMSMLVYGRIPMMISANCVAKTTGRCGNKEGSYLPLTDRYQKKLPVYLSCKHCYNIIYNSVVLSLHSHLKQIERLGLSAVRLDFTDESAVDVGEVLCYFRGLLTSDADHAKSPPFEEYTNGHYKRGVE